MYQTTLFFNVHSAKLEKISYETFLELTGIQVILMHTYNWHNVSTQSND